MEERLLTIKQAGEILGVSRWTIYKYIKEGHIAVAVLPSGRQRVVMSSLRDYIKSSIRKARSIRKIEKVKKVQVSRKPSTDNLDEVMTYFNRHGKYPTMEEIRAMETTG